MNTEFGVEWCRRCHRHQALSSHGGICPVCDPDGSQSAGVQERSDRALASIDRVLSGPVSLEDAVLREGARPTDGFTFADGSLQVEREIHHVQKVVNIQMVTPETWRDAREGVLGVFGRDLHDYVSARGLWILAGSIEVKVIASLFEPYTVSAPVRWWHRRVSRVWAPKPRAVGFHHELDGEAPDDAPGLWAYKVGAFGRAVDLPPGRHPSPSIWRRGGSFVIPTVRSFEPDEWQRAMLARVFDVPPEMLGGGA